MSVHFKPEAVTGICQHCSRFLSARGCVCPESSSNGRRAPARPQGKQVAKKGEFDEQDHFGLREGFK
jgi:hypothetical protein